MWPYEDFIEYWAAARLNLLGQDPYDPAAMLAMQHAAGFGVESPLMMYNPPWVLALAYPFALLDWPAARLAGLIVHAAVILLSAERLGRMLGGGSARDGETGVFSALTFFPVWTALRMGQFSVFQLAAVVGLTGLTPASGLASGALLALLLVKPQLTAVSLMIFGVWCVRVRAWRVAGGMLLALLASAVIVTLSNPSVWQQYLDAMTSRPPSHFISPTIGAVLRGWLAPSSFWLQFVPALLGAVWGLWYWTRRRDNWNWRTAGILPLFVGCLTAAYGGWTFDLIVLLPAIVLVGFDFRAKRLGGARGSVVLAFYAITQLVMLLTQSGTHQFVFVWVAPVLFILYLISRRDVAGRARSSPHDV
jgi:hypothetical protein